MTDTMVSKPADKVTGNQVDYKALEEATRHGLRTVNGIEKLGGIKGYQKWLTTPKPTKLQATPDTAIGLNVMAIAGDFWAAVVYEGLYLATLDGRVCNGDAWGIGIGDFDVAGIILYSDWSTLMSAENTFYIGAAGKEATAISIVFEVNIHAQAYTTLTGEDVGAAVSISGTCTWTGP